MRRTDFTSSLTANTHRDIIVCSHIEVQFTLIKEPATFCLCQSHKGPIFRSPFHVNSLVSFLDKIPAMQSNCNHINRFNKFKKFSY